MLFTLSQGMTGGRRAGLAAALGFALGNLVHTLVVALGVAALIAASPVAFTVLKALGALYLFFLAWLAYRARTAALATARTVPGHNLVVRCFLMNVINPKVIVFFLAFLPQFADPTRGSITLQIITLGLVFVLQVIVTFGLVGLAAGAVAERWLRSPVANRNLHLASALLYLALGIHLLLSRWRP